MPTQAFPYLVLTDGTTTITLADGAGGVTNYPPTRDMWAPAVAGLSPGAFGRGPYADVAEEIEINIRGATPAVAMANLVTLASLLDQAERWYRGENVNAVLLQYAPQGSTVAATGTPYQAVVLGRASGDETSGVNLSAQFASVGMISVIQGVRVRLLRIGQWLIGPVNTDGTDADNSGEVMTCTLASTFGGPIAHSPLALTLGNVSTTNIATLYPGFVFVAGNSPVGDVGIKVINGGTSGASAPFSLINESANNARSGASTLRYTPTVTTFVTKRIGAISWSSAKRLGIFATVRNNSATTSFQIRAGYSKDTAQVAAVKTGTVLIGTNSTSPQAIFIGTLMLPNVQYGDLFVEIAASAASGTLDIDEFVVIRLDDDTSSVIGHDGMNLSGVFGAGVNVYLDLQHQLIDSDFSFILPQPFVGMHQSTVTNGIALTYRGNAQLRIGLTQINVLWLTTTGAKWRLSTGAGALQSVTATPKHYNGLLTPQ
jgi:hypothetical protein